MKFSEIIGENEYQSLIGLGDSRLDEMADRRGDVKTDIKSKAGPIIEHLIKILKWDDPLNYNKHARDIDTWIKYIQKLYIKGNRKPTQYDYQNWLFNDTINDDRVITYIIKNKLKKYNSLPALRSDVEVYDIIKHIIYQVSFELPVNEFKTITDYLPNENS